MPVTDTQMSPLLALTPVAPYRFSPAQEVKLSEVVAALKQGDEALAMPAPAVTALRATTLPSRAPRRVLLDDFSVISHIQGVLGLEFYTSRAFVRAGEGDLVLGTFAPIDGYPEYMAERLGLGRARYLPIPKCDDILPYAVCEAALAQPEKLAEIADVLNQHQDDIWIHPYMGHGPFWDLAQALQARIQAKVHVVGPPPVLCERVNNKVWFAKAVRLTLGEAFATPCQEAAKLVSVVEALETLLPGHRRVAVKLADSASGMGTGIFETASLQALSRAELTAKMSAWLAEKDWLEGISPAVAIEPWFDGLLGSPSIQLWIPPEETGPLLVEGIYDQLFYPDAPHVFLGSTPSELPAALQNALADAGAALGRVFQKLGYVGRCSFDTILVGEDLHADVQIKFVECNGRWGGTSTPMTLMNRVLGDYRAHPYVARDVDDHRLKGMAFADFLECFDDILFDVNTRTGWAMVYNVGCLAPTGKLDVITLGQTPAEARRRQDVFRRLIEERL